MSKQYLLDKEIGGVVILQDKQTPIGAEMVEVLLGDGTKEIMPKARFELLATDEISDATTAQNALKARVGALCFSTLHEYGIKMGEVNGILDAITNLVNNGFTKAQDYMWGVEYTKIPLIDVNNILREHVGKQEDNNGSAPGGGGTDKEDQRKV